MPCVYVATSYSIDCTERDAHTYMRGKMKGIPHHHGRDADGARGAARIAQGRARVSDAGTRERRRVGGLQGCPPLCLQLHGCAGCMLRRLCVCVSCVCLCVCVCGGGGGGDIGARAGDAGFGAVASHCQRALQALCPRQCRAHRCVLHTREARSFAHTEAAAAQRVRGRRPRSGRQGGWGRGPHTDCMGVRVLLQRCRRP
jgi:hypothetical protein